MNKFIKNLGLTVFTAAALQFAGCATSQHEDHQASAAKAYPLQKCVVSDETFEHGKPYVFVRDGQEIKLCCKDCLAEFDKDPAKYMAKLNAPK